MSRKCEEFFIPRARPVTRPQAESMDAQEGEGYLGTIDADTGKMAASRATCSGGMPSLCGSGLPVGRAVLRPGYHVVLEGGGQL